MKDLIEKVLRVDAAATEEGASTGDHITAMSVYRDAAPVLAREVERLTAENAALRALLGEARSSLHRRSANPLDPRNEWRPLGVRDLLARIDAAIGTPRVVSPAHAELVPDDGGAR